jgi:hypothetical protein
MRAVDPIGDDAKPPILLEDVVDRDDLGMPHLGSDASLLEETPIGLGIELDRLPLFRPRDLHGDRFFQLAIVDTVDCPEGSFPQDVDLLEPSTFSEPLLIVDPVSGRCSRFGSRMMMTTGWAIPRARKTGRNLRCIRRAIGAFHDRLRDAIFHNPTFILGFGLEAFKNVSQFLITRFQNKKR